MNKIIKKTILENNTVDSRAHSVQYNKYPVIGWNEWVSLPELDIDKIKVKVDTGARSSALHAYDIKEFRRRDKTFVRFKVHPKQKRSDVVVETVAELLEYRNIKNSGGKTTKRPVILTEFQIGFLRWQIELTLINRDEMGFRMLLGRQAIRRRLLVDPGKSFVLSKRDPEKIKRSK